MVILVNPVDSILDRMIGNLLYVEEEAVVLFVLFFAIQGTVKSFVTGIKCCTKGGNQLLFQSDINK